ncbi:MAG: DUF5666 domain-containing protein [Gammaproteobacteria bacterium]|nr:DUF5666 domain-containing protein [Gammaproteobacteria bacterium]
MNAQKLTFCGLGVVCLVLLGACGGGSSGPTIIVPPNPPPTEVISAVGVITELGSVTVSGVVYGTNTATVIVNGQTASFSDLKLGQIVDLEGTIEVSGPRGTAEAIDYEATVLGPVESIDGALGRLVVMGQTVLTDADTVFAAGIDPGTFDGLTVGSNAQVSGFLNGAGEVIAKRVESDSASTALQVIGSVAGLDLANTLFSINRLTVDYSTATLIELPAGMPAEGLFVLARGTLDSGILVVDELLSLYGTDGGTPGERSRAQGVVTRFNSPTDFEINGFPIVTDGSTGFVNGTIDDLQADARIHVDGDIRTDGASILASEITFGSVAGPTETVTFELSDFSDISVFSVFNVEITQDPAYLVEVTIDTEDSNRLDISTTGSTLSMSLLPATGEVNIQTLEGVVTLPVLNSIDLDGVVNVTLNDFAQSLLDVDIDGVSRLQSDSLMIGELTADVAGVSQLDLGGSRPLTTANIVVSGVSTATLNMDVGSSITGSVTGVSTIFYYGTDVNLNVTAETGSTITRLGDTRP